MTTITFLNQIPLFAKLDSHSTSRIIELSMTEEYEANQDLIVEGDYGAGCFILMEGEVDLIKNIDGVNKVLKTLSIGEIMGEISIIDGGPHTATMRAKTKVKVLHITEADFKAELQANPEMALQLLPMLARKLRELHDLSLNG